MWRKTVMLIIPFVIWNSLSSSLGAQEPLLRLSADAFELSGKTTVARFELTTLPSEPVFLFLKTRARRPGVYFIKLTLNEMPSALGEVSQWSLFWRIHRFPIPLKALKTGLNMLAVKAKMVNGNEGSEQPIEVGEAFLADHRFVPVHDALTEFEVNWRYNDELQPGASSSETPGLSFPLRGTKGWAWTPDQYLAEIPYLAKFRLNFLMNCYTSMFSSLDPFVNRWWEPLPEAKKKAFEEVVRACRKNAIDFCFSMHPQLFSERPLSLDKPEDFESLWQHYAWMQGLGVKWFNICYDDIGIEGQDKAALGKAHAGLVNRLLARLRKKDPQARVIFCPTYYSGSGEAPEARAYLGALAKTLEPDIYVFWTGDGVVTPRITRRCAEAYRKIVGRRLIIWDNYPVNDRNPTLHLGPVTGRDPGLAEVATGYMSNPLCPQNETNRIPLFTCADFALNPAAYDPLRSICRAIQFLAESPAERVALKNLVELYPGMLLFGETRTSFNPVLEKFHELMRRPDGRSQAAVFLRRVEDVLQQLDEAFPGEHGPAKETIRLHLDQMKVELGK